jgi:hypothetical protein
MLAFLVQVSTQLVGAVATAPQQPDASVLAPYFFTGSGIVLAQKWMKGKRFYARFVQAFPGADKWAHRTVAIIGAAIGAAGIHYSWNYDILHGGSVQAQLPALVDLVQNLFHAAGDLTKVVITQQILYEMTHQLPYAPPAAGTGGRPAATAP